MAGSISDLLRVGGFSGIDTIGIIDQLMSVERLPETRMKDKQARLGYKKDAWNEINTSLLNLKTSLGTLLDRGKIQAKLATTSDASYVTATTDSSAATGAYTISISQLATTTRVTSGTGATGFGLGKAIDPTKAVTDSSAGMGTVVTAGTFTVNGVQIEVIAGDTLNSIIGKLNGAAAGVAASYDAVADKLVLTASTPGGAIDVGAAGDTSNFLSATGVLTATRAGDAKSSVFHLGRINPAQKLSAGNYAAAITGDASGNGSMVINGVTIAYNKDSDSLNDVLNRINNSTANVTATYDSLQDRIILANKTTGSVGLTRAEGTTGNFLTATGLLATAAGVSTTVGSNAVFSIAELNGGASITSTTNEVTGVISGVTLKLVKETPVGATVKVTIDQDIKAVKDAVHAFVDRYNEAITLVNNRLNEKLVMNPKSEADKKVGILRADPVLVKLKSDLGRIVTGNVAGLPATLDSLAEIGVTYDSTDFGKSGKLVVDDVKLEQKIKENPQEVANLFFNDINSNGMVDSGENGIAVAIDSVLVGLTDTTMTLFGSVSAKKGSIPRMMDQIDTNVQQINDDIARFEDRMELRQQNLIRQFTAMEQSLSLIQSQMSWLNGQLGGSVSR